MAGFRKWQCVQKMAVPVRGGGWGVGGMGYVRVMLVYMCVSGRGGVVPACCHCNFVLSRLSKKENT